jgi:hypothetical protein
MRTTRLERLRLLTVLLAAICLPAVAAAPVSVPPGEYDLTTQTMLPHLEEALRYTTTHTRRCLRSPDATEMFPLLQHKAFASCDLVPNSAASDGLQFTLRCPNHVSATGSAVFEVHPGYVSALLEIKMGGKNMTLSQRLHGPRVGPCSESTTK